MPAKLILNQSQAEAVYSAMCVLNNVDFRACDLSFGKAIVKQTSSGTISVIGTVGDDEQYASQAAFATAYGLNSDTAPAVCGECGGRGVVETGIGMMSCTCCPA